MAAVSPFGILKPPKRNKSNQPLQPPNQQPYYSQFALQINPQPQPLPPSVPRPIQHHQHHQHYQQGPHYQHPQPHGRPPTVPPAANYAPNGAIHPHFRSQPQSPALNGLHTGPHQPQHPQTMAPIPVASVNTSPANPSAVLTAPPAPTSAIDASESQPCRRTAASRPHKRRRSTDNDVEPAPSPPAPVVPRVPPRPRTPHPFNRGPYNTLEDAIFSLQLHVFTSGYGVSQKRTVKEKLASGKYDPNGDVIRKDFACDKGGNEFVSQSRGARRRESKKCGCPWKAAIRRLRREGDRWFIEILDNQHNHPITSPDEMHTLASYRRWQRDNNAGIRSAIDRLARAAAMPARDIAAYLRGDVQDDDLDRIDTQILRALSMNDKDLPGSEKEGGSIVFEIVARRPVIILQDNDKTSPARITKGDSNNTLNAPPAPMNENSALLNRTNIPTTTTAPLNGSPTSYRQTAPSNFTNHSPNPPPASPPPETGVDGVTG